ncbi:MAG TPA: DUF2911 domain-containing protein [Terriglobales bacterium]|jgi:hypothetical protein
MRRHAAFVTLFVFAAVFFVCAQQDKSKRPSPPASADCKFSDGKTIHSDYSSPRMKGRKIFGGLVPYGEVWRTGANEATTFVTDTNLTVNGKPLPAGSYTMFTIPNADKWTLIINKKTAEWGIPYRYESDELLRTDMKVEKLDAPVENFTIAFHPHGNACMLHLNWENTGATVELMEAPKQ